MALRLPPDLHFDRRDWDYLAIVAQYRITGALIERYTAQAADPDNLSAHDPRGQLVALGYQLHVLATRKRAAELMFYSVGRTPPDYDAYRNHWKRSDL